MTSMQAVVTGAGGFIGRALCERLCSAGTRVIALHRRSRPGPWAAEIIHDLVTGPPPADALAGVDTVFHLAGNAHVSGGAKCDGLHRENSVIGTNNLLTACGPKIRRFTYISSVKAIGESTPVAGLDESATPRPTTAYGRARLEAEGLVLATASTRHAVVLRLPLVYGPGMKGNLKRMLHGLASGHMPRFPDLGSRRSMVHVQDVCNAAIAAIANTALTGRVYLIADGEAYSLPRLQAAMCAALGRPLPRIALSHWMLRLAAAGGDLLGTLGRRPVPFDSVALQRLTQSALYHGDRACADFGFAPRRQFEDALGEVVEVMRDSAS